MNSTDACEVLRSLKPFYVSIYGYSSSTESAEDIEVPIVRPNPDIAGTGVILAFIVSAYLTLILVIVYYVSGCLEDQHSNRIDRGVIRTIAKLPWIKPKPQGAWKTSIRKAVLMFSDQQLVTGLAILGSAFTQLFNNVSAYHWQILCYLAFFSSITHLTTLTVLRQYFRDHAGIRNWRLSLMLMTGSMLLAALIPTGVNGWMSTTSTRYDRVSLGGVPAICYYQELSSKGSFSIESTSGFSTIISILILSYGFFSRALRLSAKATRFTHHVLSDVPRRWLQTRLDRLHKRVERPGNNPCLKMLWKTLYVILLTFYLDLKTMRDILESMLWEILWLISALFWGSLHLWYARMGRSMQVFNEVSISPSGDDEWTFGQCISIILLAFPLISLIESYIESKKAGPHTFSTSASSLETSQEHKRHGSYDLLPPTCCRPIRALTLPHASRRQEALPVYADCSRSTDDPFCSNSSADSILDQKEGKFSYRTTSNLSSFSASKRSIEPPHLRDFYDIVWFRYLVVMALLLLQVFMIMIILAASRVNFLIIPSILWSLFYIFVSIFAWTGTFTFRMVFLKQRSFSQPSLERKVTRWAIRFCASIWFLGLSSVASLFVVLGLIRGRFLPYV